MLPGDRRLPSAGPGLARIGEARLGWAVTRDWIEVGLLRARAFCATIIKPFVRQVFKQ